MDFRKEHRLGVFEHKTDVAITTPAYPGNSDCNGHATVVLRTGEVWLQTYADADQCRALAETFAATAAELDRQAMKVAA